MKLFFKNWQIKLLALTTAVFLWIFVVGVQHNVYLFPSEISVRIINMDQNVSMASGIPKVYIRVKTEPENINSIHANDFDAEVDAKGLGVGEHQAKVMVTNRNPKITVVAIEPSMVTFKLEAITTKQVPLEVKVQGSPAFGFGVKDVKLSSDKVEVTGAVSVLDKIDKMSAGILLNGVESADIIRNVVPQFQDSVKISPDSVKINPLQIQASVRIEAKKVPETLPASPSLAPNGNLGGAANKPVESGNLRKSFMANVYTDEEFSKLGIKEVIPRNLLVTVEGKESSINSINNDSIRVRLNMQKLKIGGIYDVLIEDIQLPRDVMLIDFTPKKLQVKF